MMRVYDFNLFLETLSVSLSLDVAELSRGHALPTVGPSHSLGGVWTFRQEVRGRHVLNLCQLLSLCP